MKKLYAAILTGVFLCCGGCRMSDRELDDLFASGLALQKNRQYADAVGYYDKILEQTPRDCNTLFNKAICLSMLSRHREALRVLRKCMKYHPERSVYHVHAAGEALRLWELQEALAYAEKSRALAKDKTEKVDALSVLSDVYYALDRPKDYMPLLQECAELDPDDDVSVSNYVIALLECPERKLRDPQKAKILAENLVKRRNTARAWFALEKILIADGDLANARIANRKALEALTDTDDLPLFMETEDQSADGKRTTKFVSLRQLVEKSSLRYARQ